MICNACYNAYIIFKYPEFEDAQRKDAQSEIQDFLKAHPTYAQSFFSTVAQGAAGEFVGHERANNDDFIHRIIFSCFILDSSRPSSSQPRPSGYTQV